MENIANIDNIEKNMEMLYLNNLIKACEKSNVDKNVLEKKLNTLNSESEVQPKLKKEISHNSLANMTESPTSNQQYSDDYLYQKAWTKLTAIHKIIKVKEYVNALLVKNDSDKQELKEKLVEMVKNKVLTKKDSVLYDSVKGKVISIPILEYKNGKYIINSE